MIKGLIIFGVIVLVIVLLGFGFFLFLKSSCGVSTQGVSTIDSKAKNEMNKIFTELDKKIVVYPSEREVELEKGTIGKGFAFSIRNSLNQSSNFRYNIGVYPDYDIQEKCNTSIKEAENYLLTSSGSLIIPAESIMEEPEMIRLNIPINAKNCIVVYRIDVKNNNTLYVSSKIYINIIPKKNIIIKFKEFLINLFYSKIC